MLPSASLNSVNKHSAGGVRLGRLPMFILSSGPGLKRLSLSRLDKQSLKWAAEGKGRRSAAVRSVTEERTQEKSREQRVVSLRPDGKRTKDAEWISNECVLIHPYASGFTGKTRCLVTPLVLSDAWVRSAKVFVPMDFKYKRMKKKKNRKQNGTCFCGNWALNFLLFYELIRKWVNPCGTESGKKKKKANVWFF